MNTTNLKKNKNKKIIEKFNQESQRAIFGTSMVWILLTVCLLCMFTFIQPDNDKRIPIYKKLFADHVTYDSPNTTPTTFFYGDANDTIIREYGYLNIASSMFLLGNFCLCVLHLTRITKFITK
tara:strand:- start:1399 stop:1767 length:369 start_codon:yes stop_codon:yes gene_type:complete